MYVYTFVYDSNKINKELCQARDMSDTQFFNRQELTIMINTLCKQ